MTGPDHREWTLSDEDQFQRVYQELKRVARSKVRPGVGQETLEATGLVHEVWLRLSGEDGPRYRDEAHFYATAARAMRWILVDRARHRLATRRAHGREPLVEDPVGSDSDPLEILALDEALERLKTHSERRAEIVELRHFAGLTVEEVARVLDTSVATVKREWSIARALLRRDMTAQTRDLGATAARDSPPNREPRSGPSTSVDP